ncbi:ferrous iron transport protein B [Photobacterium sanguinicancri]|uniref:ferrous iron transport protein B n=1 Tax=Photobacterium sanguinicancri TaxID=875932 RepID=UPI0021C2EFAD|nr:ferrous iron transport protein B [Photobacterium sanguinicancri]
MTILLAGQQNAGKSTLFNMLTGARQHVANYPGVTVDKKVGFFKVGNETCSLIDLPGTYSLSSFSLEERVTRQALSDLKPTAVLNVLDAVNLSRGLNLTMQLIEQSQPLVLVINMMDIAQSEGITIDSDLLSKRLGLPVIETIGKQARGKQLIADSISTATVSQLPYSLPKLTQAQQQLVLLLQSNQHYLGQPIEWLALRLLEQDAVVEGQLKEALPTEEWEKISVWLEETIPNLTALLTMSVSDYVMTCRNGFIQQLLQDVVHEATPDKETRTEKIDRWVLNRYIAPCVLLATVFLIYQLSIVYGYELTNYTWPYLAATREFIAGFLPAAGFLHDPYVRSMGLWIVDSANTLLNYVPIFLILFGLIAALEDSGYMARIAFIVDKILHKFGLHGQSTLPMILSGVFAGGCAVPGIMATKGIPDHRARLATILTVPFMNCLAKVPLYTLLVSIFFVEHKALMMFYIATITIIAALLVAKLLTKTVLRGTETAPFVMELPRYHMPTLRSVLTRAFERTWIYIKKVGTIVIAVSVVIFCLLQFPGVPNSQQQTFEQQATAAIDRFYTKLKGNPYLDNVPAAELPALVNYYTDFKRAKLNATSPSASKSVNVAFSERNALFYPLVVPPKGDKSAKKISRELRKLASSRKKIRRKMKELRLETSLLGQLGRSMEPVTQLAGFDWKINVALLSSFAARESSVATLGVLFQQDDDSNDTLEARMSSETKDKGSSDLSAVAVILFFALYPPCLATMIMIRVQTGQYRWMLLAIFLPTGLGFLVATTAYTLGNLFALSGIAMMSWIYGTSLATLLLVACSDTLKRWKQRWLTPQQLRNENG